MKKIYSACLIIVISLTMCKLSNSQTYSAGDYIAEPYYGDMKVKFYVASTAALFYTFDLAPEFINFPIPFGPAGPNATTIYDGKIFISFDKDGTQGGVLIYNYSDIYPVRNGISPIIIPTASVAGIAIHPVTGDLYVAKFFTGANSGIITRYTKVSGYSTASAFDLPVPNYWVNYFTGIAFDAAGNLWTGSLDEHRVLCFTASSAYDNFYVIINGAGTYPAAMLSGGSVNVKLFSAPEGFAFDNAFNLWVSNNNDVFRTNNPGEGTFININNAYTTFLLTQPVSGTRGNPNVAVTYTVPSASTNVYYYQDAKFGGSAFKDNTIYLNDQGNSNVWKWDITSAYNNANFITSGINTTYPGFGGLSFNDNTFPFGIRTLSENIPGSYSLMQNYPNPFNPSTKIQFQIVKTGNVKLAVFDILGREVETLLNRRLNPGSYEFSFDASHLASGIYFYRLETQSFRDTKKMILLK
jgi:hypothetical protein